ncbi:MAG TPA: condensation domain-containing protein, partial [Xanthobacteraceae bacterium]
MAQRNWYSWSPPREAGPQRPADAHENSSLPLSDAQLGIWFAQALDPSSPAYNLGEYLEIRGSLDAALFESAVREVVEEAEALRVRLVLSADGPRQIVSPQADWSMPFIDISSAAHPQQLAEEWMKTDLARPVDISHGPLFGFALFKAAPDLFFWYARYHHIVADGVGLALVAQRVADVYTALVTGRIDDDRRFGTLAHVLEEEAAYRASPRFEQDRKYWTSRLADLPPAARLSERPYVKSPGFVRYSGLLPFSTDRRLRSLAQQIGVTLPQLVTAAAAIFVHRLTGAEDVVLDVPLTARMTPVARRTPGMMSNVLPVRLSVSSNLTVSALVRETTQRMRHVIRHQRYNIANLRRDIGRAADQRAFGPTVNFMPFDYDLRFDGHLATAHNLAAGPVEDLSIALYDRSDGREVRIDFDGNPASYDKEELRNLQRRFLRLLAAIESPDQKIGRLEILEAQERHTILEEWNATARALPAASLPELFAAQAAKTPDAVA